MIILKTKPLSTITLPIADSVLSSSYPREKAQVIRTNFSPFLIINKVIGSEWAAEWALEDLQGSS
jgi:hypothetical protein